MGLVHVRGKGGHVEAPPSCIVQRFCRCAGLISTSSLPEPALWKTAMTWSAMIPFAMIQFAMIPFAMIPFAMIPFAMA